MNLTFSLFRTPFALLMSLMFNLETTMAILASTSSVSTQMIITSMLSAHFNFAWPPMIASSQIMKTATSTTANKTDYFQTYRLKIFQPYLTQLTIISKLSKLIYPTNALTISNKLQFSIGYFPKCSMNRIYQQCTNRSECKLLGFPVQKVQTKLQTLKPSESSISVV